MPDSDNNFGFPEPTEPIHDAKYEEGTESSREEMSRLAELAKLRSVSIETEPVPIQDLTGRPSLQSELSSVLNRYSAENGSGTPDFILAEYLLGCLEAFNKAHHRRAEWHGKPLDEFGMTQDEQFVSKNLEREL